MSATTFQASTFQAIDPTTGSAFGDQIAEMSASDVSGLISKAVATKTVFVATKVNHSQIGNT